MVSGIGLAHKIGKQNRERPGITNGLLNATSPTSHFHGMAPLGALLSFHIQEREKIHSLDAKTNFSAGKIYIRLNYKNG